MPLDVVNDDSGLQMVILSEPCGSSLENTGRSPTTIFGGISICFAQANNSGLLEQNEYGRQRLWSLENGPLDQTPNGGQSSVNLILKPLDKDLKIWPCRFELRLKISLSPGRLTLMPSVRNNGDTLFSFTLAIRNYLSVSDISEVRVEGLEMLDYLDNVMQQWRFALAS